MSDIKYSRVAYIKNKILSKICFWGKIDHYRKNYNLLKMINRRRKQKIIYVNNNHDMSMIANLSTNEQIIYHLLSIYENKSDSNISVDINIKNSEW